MPRMRAIALSRAYPVGGRTVYALREADLAVEAGELVVLRGPSGSGKTTLINLLAGLDLPTGGKVLLGGVEVSALSARARDRLRQREIGLIFQSIALVPFLSAYENVDLSLRIARTPARERQAQALKWLEYVGLSGRAQHRPAELSGGEQQRVAIARAVARAPQVLLADEPTAALDTKMGGEVMDLFEALAHREGMAIVMTTHDPRMMERADRVYTLRDGRIVDAQ